MDEALGAGAGDESPTGDPLGEEVQPSPNSVTNDIKPNVSNACLV